jgi:hypothetical protein
MYENRKWAIITLSDYNEAQLQRLVDNAIQTSVNTLKKSLDNTKTILKWDGNTPSCFEGMDTYTHSEILAILSEVDGDWLSTDV